MSNTQENFDRLARAVGYVLDRAQRDPDLGYQLGPFTEAFERLAAAEAALMTRDPDEHKRVRGRSLSDRKPGMLVATELVDRWEREADAMAGPGPATTAERGLLLRCAEQLREALRGNEAP